jgi:hypothetical protein
MIVSILGYFFSMVAAFAIFMVVLGGISESTSFAKVHLQPYPEPPIVQTLREESAQAPVPVATQSAESVPAKPAPIRRIAAAKSRHPRATADLKPLSLVPQRSGRNETLALGYAEAPANKTLFPSFFKFGIGQ